MLVNKANCLMDELKRKKERNKKRKVELKLLDVDKTRIEHSLSD